MSPCWFRGEVRLVDASTKRAVTVFSAAGSLGNPECGSLLEQLVPPGRLDCCLFDIDVGTSRLSATSPNPADLDRAVYSGGAGLFLRIVRSAREPHCGSPIDRIEIEHDLRR